MKVVVVFLGLAFLLGVAACSQKDDGAPLAPTTIVAGHPPEPTLEPTDPPPTPTPDELGGTVPFFSIAKGAARSRRLGVREPTLEVVRNSGELGKLIRWNRPGRVPRRVKEGLQEIRMLTTFVVVAYSGPKATDGLKIAIVTVVTKSPRPGRAANDVRTHPYHVVGISKQDMFVPSRANWLMVTEDGTVLAETSPDRIGYPESPVVTPDPTPPTERPAPTPPPSPTPAPTKRPTLAPTRIVAGYTRKEEPCDRDSKAASSVCYQDLGGGLWPSITRRTRR